MAVYISLLVFMLVSSGFYLMMRRNAWEVLLGFNLLGHGVNLMLLAGSGWSRNTLPPVLTSKELVRGAPPAYADPIPQALILTAIVIGFAVTAYFAVLVLRGYEETQTIEVGEVPKGDNEP
jgi:multisubunit Na+/H+ antiporter MnhC subunit